MAKRRGRKNEIVGTFDCETDPFLAGRIPFPFAACAYFGDNDYSLLWESDSKTDFIARVIRLLRRLPVCTLYAHNGGRFDFHFFLEYAEEVIEIRNGRVTTMQIGNVTLKDSFPLMPFALEEFRKTKIDYAIFERRRRQKHRAKIESYLLDDCRDLLELVTGFRAIVGERDTIGSAAFLQMRKLDIEIQNMNETHDAMFRPFYFGGRVQALRYGVLQGPYKYLDINSAYPFAMMQKHAHGSEYKTTRRLPPLNKIGNCFLRLNATSRGALPLRAEDGSLSFPHTSGEFYATGWEVRAGLETKTLKIDKVLEVWTPKEFICFEDYVSRFFALRQEAKKSGDKIRQLAYKYLLNSGYGKFAQNPRDFKEYKLAPYGKIVKGFNWETDFGEISLWYRPSFTGWGFYDVATGASITGFVRAMLWRAVCQSRDVVYMDTDSMICRTSGVAQGDKLGQWKLEGKGAYVKRVAIAGKKLYGARLSWAEMLQLCKGSTIVWENEAPTFSIGGAHFVRRRITSTGVESE
jgi:hypothetical protein